MKVVSLIVMSLILAACNSSSSVENQSPVANAGADITVVERAEVTLSGTASDEDGSIGSIAWSQIDGPTVELSATNTETISFTAPSLLEAASLVFKLSVTDDQGAVSEDEVTVDITLEPTDVIAIEANAVVMCAMAQNREVKCWGDGGYYNLGNVSGDIIFDAQASSAIDFGTLTPVFVEAGEKLGCALFDNGEVRCWGQKLSVGLDDLTSDISIYVGDDTNEMGNNLPVIDLGTGLTAVQLSVGRNHACAVLNDGGLKCWGRGDSGRLGNGSTQSYGDVTAEMGDNLPYVDLGTDGTGANYTAKYVEAGYSSTCAILNNDQLKCWGSNRRSQLGYGDFEDRGDEAGEMGNNLEFLDVGSGRSVEKVFVYYEHTCAILDNGALKCWGRNNYGEIGLASGDRTIGNNVPENNEVQCNQGADQAKIEVTVLTPSNVTCPLGGFEFRVGLDTGGNDIFQPNPTLRLICHKHDIDAVYDTTTIAPGAVCATGGKSVTYDYDTNDDGLLDDNSMNLMGDALPSIDFGSTEPVIDVVLGDEFTCALLADSTLKCWGPNYNGEAGLDVSDNWGAGENETPANRTATNLGSGVNPIQIAGAYYNTCALLDNGKVKCWGYDNDVGTLGVPEYFGEVIGDGNPAPEMGDNLEYLNLFRDTP